MMGWNKEEQKFKTKCCKANYIIRLMQGIDREYLSARCVKCNKDVDNEVHPPLIKTNG